MLQNIQGFLRPSLAQLAMCSVCVVVSCGDGVWALDRRVRVPLCVDVLSVYVAHSL